MSEAKHTPGPWRADWDDNGQWYIEPLGVTGTKLRGDSGDCIEAANARLIAAAPELLGCLERLDIWFHRGHHHEIAQELGKSYYAEFLKGGPLRVSKILWDEAEAALRKARGE